MNNSDLISLKAQFEDIEFETHPSNVIKDAVENYEAQQDPLEDYVSPSLLALSVIGHWFVGQEPR